MITFADDSVLNLYADGTRALNDKNGVVLDPQTGQPVQPVDPAPTAPETGADRILRLLNGDESVENLTEAVGLLSALTDAVLGEIDPAEWVEQLIKMVLEVASAVETPEKNCRILGWDYGVMYGALDMGSPPEPTFSGNTLGPDQDALDKQAWQEGAASAQQQLANGQSGIALRNKVLLRIAYDGGQPATTLLEIWKASIAKTGGPPIIQALYDSLPWPDPPGTL
jgi:hypothetical protein